MNVYQITKFKHLRQFAINSRLIMMNYIIFLCLFQAFEALPKNTSPRDSSCSEVYLDLRTEAPPCIGSFPEYSANADVCRIKCDLDEECESWTWNKRTGDCIRMPCFMKRLMYQFSEIGFPLDVNLDQCLNIPDEGDHTCENYKFSDCKPLDENLFIDATGGLFSSSDCQQICTAYPGCNYITHTTDNCRFYKANPILDCNIVMGPKRAAQYSECFG